MPTALLIVVCNNGFFDIHKKEPTKTIRFPNTMSSPCPPVEGAVCSQTAQTNQNEPTDQNDQNDQNEQNEQSEKLIEPSLELRPEEIAAVVAILKHSKLCSSIRNPMKQQNSSPKAGRCAESSCLQSKRCATAAKKLKWMHLLAMSHKH
jgi:hypothetical protein